MGSSKKRQAEKLMNRKMLKLQHHIEMLGAAFCKETDSLPSETCLMVEKAETSDGRPDGLKYYFVKHAPKVNDQASHPHVKFIMDVAGTLSHAHKNRDAVALTEALNTLLQFMVQYDPTLAEVSDEDSNVQGANAPTPAPEGDQVPGELGERDAHRADAE